MVYIRLASKLTFEQRARYLIYMKIDIYKCLLLFIWNLHMHMVKNKKGIIRSSWKIITKATHR